MKPFKRKHWPVRIKRLLDLIHRRTTRWRQQASPMPSNHREAAIFTLPLTSILCFSEQTKQSNRNTLQSPFTSSRTQLSNSLPL